MAIVLPNATTLHEQLADVEQATRDLRRLLGIYRYRPSAALIAALHEAAHLLQEEAHELAHICEHGGRGRPRTRRDDAD